MRDAYINYKLFLKDRIQIKFSQKSLFIEQRLNKKIKCGLEMTKVAQVPNSKTPLLKFLRTKLKV